MKNRDKDTKTKRNFILRRSSRKPREMRDKSVFLLPKYYIYTSMANKGKL